MALTPAVAADVNASQRFPALITSISLKDSGANSSTAFSLGRLKEGAKLTIEPMYDTSSGKVPIHLGYNIKLEALVLASGTNARAALNSVIQNDHDTILTDVNGSTFTFLSANFQIAAGIQEDSDFEGAIYQPITGAGYLTKAQFTAQFAQGA